MEESISGRGQELALREKGIRSVFRCGISYIKQAAK
jgi:hypothetical protein